MLFWETLQCNKRFRSFIIDTDRGHDFVILVLFYALEYKTDAAKQGVVRMCIFVLQTLSTEPNFGKRLNKKFEGQMYLPASIKLADFSGSYADFLILVMFIFRTNECCADFVSPSIRSSQQVKGNLMLYILRCWLQSITLQLTWRISAYKQAQSC